MAVCLLTLDIPPKAGEVASREVDIYLQSCKLNPFARVTVALRFDVASMSSEDTIIAMDPDQYPYPKTHRTLDISHQTQPPSARLRAFFTTLRPDKRTMPRLFRYLKAFFLDAWFDMVCILGVAAIAGAVRPIPLLFPSSTLTAHSLFSQVWIIDARPSRLFPLLTPDGATYSPTISYPYREPIFNSLVTGLLCGFIPIAVIVFSQLFIRSFADCSSAILGLLYSLATGTCFQVILKKSVGGLRPHFLSVCKPVIPAGVVGEGFNGIMYSVDDVCTGKPHEITNALQSFPSGHSEIAFAGLGYLALYLFTHLGIGDRSRASQAGFWRMIFVIVPILFATYIACTLVLGYHHHAHDCFFGAAVGIMTALMGFRIAFRSITDCRTNWRPRVGRRLKREMDRHAEESESSEMVDVTGVVNGSDARDGALRRPSPAGVGAGSGSGSGSETESEAEHRSPV